MNFFLGNYYMPDGIKPIDLKLKTPIEWIPLETVGDETLLITKNVIDWECFGFEEDMGRGWTGSYLKGYLDKLYYEIFSKEEQEVIIKKPIGKLFVLSAEEIVKYMPNSEDRRAAIFYVTEDEGCFEIFIEHSTYWLRNDIVSTDFEVANIDAFGEVEWSSPERDEIGIRPCIYVDTKKARILTAKAGYNNWHHFWEFDEF